MSKNINFTLLQAALKMLREATGQILSMSAQEYNIGLNLVLSIIKLPALLKFIVYTHAVCCSSTAGYDKLVTVFFKSSILHIVIHLQIH